MSNELYEIHETNEKNESSEDLRARHGINRHCDNARNLLAPPPGALVALALNRSWPKNISSRNEPLEFQKKLLATKFSGTRFVRTLEADECIQDPLESLDREILGILKSPLKVNTYGQDS